MPFYPIWFSSFPAVPGEENVGMVSCALESREAPTSLKEQRILEIATSIAKDIQILVSRGMKLKIVADDFTAALLVIPGVCHLPEKLILLSLDGPNTAPFFFRLRLVIPKNEKQMWHFIQRRHCPCRWPFRSGLYDAVQSRRVDCSPVDFGLLITAVSIFTSYFSLHNYHKRAGHHIYFSA